MHSPSGSSTPDGADDFDAVLVAEAVLRETAPRHQLLVDFDGETLSGELQLLDQLGQGQVFGDFIGCAINDNLHLGLDIGIP